MDKPIERLPVVDEIELRLARQLLFRRNPNEELVLASVQTLAGRFRVSTNAVREALQRLVALGLIVIRSQGPVGRPLFTVRSMDTLVLEARCMETEEQRRRVLRHYTDLARRVAWEGATHVVRGNRREITKLSNHVREAIDLIERGGYAMKLAHQLHFVCWISTCLSGDALLHWTANALDRAYWELQPWLIRAAEDVRNVKAWELAQRSIDAGDADSVGERIVEALGPYHQHALQFAQFEKPDGVHLPHLHPVSAELDPSISTMPPPGRPGSDDDGIPF